MCPGCEIFAERIDIKEPRDYQNLARQLIEAVTRRALRLTRADCPLEDLLGKTFPGDCLSHVFQCTLCSRQFTLHADTYHGRVEWEPHVRGETPIVQ
jgi:hypothetical protein